MRGPWHTFYHQLGRQCHEKRTDDQVHALTASVKCTTQRSTMEFIRRLSGPRLCLVPFPMPHPAREFSEAIDAREARGTSSRPSILSSRRRQWALAARLASESATEAGSCIGPSRAKGHFPKYFCARADRSVSIFHMQRYLHSPSQSHRTGSWPPESSGPRHAGTIPWTAVLFLPWLASMSRH